MAFLKTLIPGGAIQRRRIGFAICLIFAALFSGARTARCAPPDEYQVKAAFLFNFTKFVVWPSNAFSDANAPLVIGVLGHDPFGSYLDDIVRGERADNRQLAVERYRSSGEIKNCHVLFISRSESGRLNQIVSSLNHRNMLIVTDADGGEGGVIIRFVREGNKIRFKIDTQAAKASNLTISSKLLRLG
jgi:uncharacterized protein DUF4154